MSQTKEQHAVRDDMIARPGFEVALRGYDKRQVDQYVARADSEISGLVAERKRAYGQIQELAGQLQHAQAELAELRQRPALIERASFRHLGPMVDQILALAEKQAEAIVTTAREQAAQLQSEAEKALAEALDQADKLRADGDAAREQAEQEAARVHEESVQLGEQTRAEAEAMLEAARAQIQQEIETARAQTQEEVAQWKANVERELTEQRNAVNQKNAAMHAEAQQYSNDLRRRADEQTASHQQQLALVQHEIQAHRQALTQLQSELDTAQQQLTQTRKECGVAERELQQLQQRLNEVTQELNVQMSRLEEARRAAEIAEKHAKDVRARVQREAERVAHLAAAAVMAAAARGSETGEYPQVVARANGNDHHPEETAAAPAEQPLDAAPTDTHATADGHEGSEMENAVPAQREPHPERSVPIGE